DGQRSETAHGWPYFLPGGKAILFSIKTTGSWDDARIAVLILGTREKRVLLEGGSSPKYVPTGHLAYARGGSLFAVPFDPERLQVKGTPSPVLEGVATSFGGFADYSFSDSGDLVYRPDSTEEKTTMVWVDRTGKVEPLNAPPRAYANPIVSPDGQRVAMSIGSGSQQISDIWVYDLGRRTLTKLTYGFLNFAPAWTPDGRRVMFRNRGESGQNGIFWAPADGSGPPELLAASDEPATPGSWLPDGSALVFYQGNPGRTVEISVLAVQGGSGDSSRRPRALIKNGRMPQFSPDGRWLAYVSNESGVQQVYVQPFPSLVGKWQVSTDGGDFSALGRSGRGLVYRNGNKMMAVDIETKEAFRAGVPKVLFEGGYATSPAGLQPGWGYDVSPDGKRFLMIKPSEEGAVHLHVVENWFEELKKRAPRSPQ